jgi:HD-GYP domain-containing protein (c-di-GMP phosphodiesterase class II)
MSTARENTTSAVAATYGLVGLLLALWAVRSAGASALLVAATLGAVVQRYEVRLRDGISVSFNNLATLTLVAIVGTAPAVVAAAAGVATMWLRMTRMGERDPKGRLERAAFNLGCWTLAAATAGAILTHLAPADLASTMVALTLAAWVYVAVTILSVSLIVSLHTGEAPNDVLASVLPTIAVQPVLVGIATLAGALYEVSVLAPWLLAVSLLLAYQGFVAFRDQRSAAEFAIRVMVDTIESRDPYTRGHGERVGQLAHMLATEMGLSYRLREAARLGGLLHDLGKVAVPGHLLMKGGALDCCEIAVMREHPSTGYRIVGDIDGFEDLASCVLYHHERIDGGGYPAGISGDEIPLQARIVTVVDAFDAMTTHRAYRAAMPIEEALSRLREAAGTQFDPLCVAAFERVITREGWEVDAAPQAVAAPPNTRLAAVPPHPHAATA